MDFNILKTELDDISYVNLTNIECANTLNTKNILSKKSISTSSIKQYLMLANLWLVTKHSSAESAEVAIDALNNFSEFDVNDTNILAMLTTVLSNLESDITNFTNTHTQTILGLGDVYISRAQELGLSTVTSGDVEAGRM